MYNARAGKLLLRALFEAIRQFGLIAGYGKQAALLVQHQDVVVRKHNGQWRFGRWIIVKGARRLVIHALPWVA